MLIQDHINYNNGGNLSNFTKGNLNGYERSFDISESLSNMLANFSNELIK